MLAMPFKRFERGPVEFLTSEETTALLNAPDATTWLGRRDQVLLPVAVQTGRRNSELTRLRRQDVQFLLLSCLLDRLRAWSSPSKSTRAPPAAKQFRPTPLSESTARQPYVPKSTRLRPFLQIRT